MKSEEQKIQEVLLAFSSNPCPLRQARGYGHCSKPSFKYFKWDRYWFMPCKAHVRSYISTGSWEEISFEEAQKLGSYTEYMGWE